MGVYAYTSESLHIGVQEVFKELDNDQNVTVAGVSKKLYTMTQVEEAKDHLQKENGDKKKMSELVLGVNTVQAVGTRVCNNPNCGVTFTPAQPSFYSCNNCHKSSFRRNDSLKLTADALKKHKEKKKLQQQRTKYTKNNGNKGVEKNDKNGGKAFQVSAAEVDSDNDGQGREEEGMSSNRPEVVTLQECLEAHPDNENLLYFTDSETTLQAINKWLGGGAKLSLAKTADTDALRAIIVKLQQRVKAKAATLLIKIETGKGKDVEYADQQDHLPMGGGL